MCVYATSKLNLPAAERTVFLQSTSSEGPVFKPPVTQITHTQTAPTKHHVPELDGLRALAVLAVVVHHLFLNWGQYMGSLGPPAKFAWIGVDIFFVLSGYLITGILLRSPPNRHSMANFYLKRALRIWPLLQLKTKLHGV